MKNRDRFKQLLVYFVCFLLTLATCEAMLVASLLAAKLISRSLLAVF